MINRWRATIDLEPVPMAEAPSLAETLKIPFTYCWSPALVPKPRDWAEHIGWYSIVVYIEYTHKYRCVWLLLPATPVVPTAAGSRAIPCFRPTACVYRLWKHRCGQPATLVQYSVAGSGCVWCSCHRVTRLEQIGWRRESKHLLHRRLSPRMAVPARFSSRPPRRCWDYRLWTGQRETNSRRTFLWRVGLHSSVYWARAH